MFDGVRWESGLGWCGFRDLSSHESMVENAFFGGVSPCALEGSFEYSLFGGVFGYVLESIFEIAFESALESILRERS